MGVSWRICVSVIYYFPGGVCVARSNFSQGLLKHHNNRVCAAEHAVHGPFRVLEQLQGLALIFERRAGSVDRHRVNSPHPECGVVILSEDTSRHGCRLAQQRFGFFEVL